MQNEASTAESEAKAADMKVKHVTKDLAAKSKALAANDKAAIALTKDLEGHRAAVATAQVMMAQEFNSHFNSPHHSLFFDVASAKKKTVGFMRRIDKGTKNCG